MERKKNWKKEFGGVQAEHSNRLQGGRGEPRISRGLGRNGPGGAGAGGAPYRCWGGRWPHRAWLRRAPRKSQDALEGEFPIPLSAGSLDNKPISCTCVALSPVCPQRKAPDLCQDGYSLSSENTPALPASLLSTVCCYHIHYLFIHYLGGPRVGAVLAPGSVSKRTRVGCTLPRNLVQPMAGTRASNPSAEEPVGGRRRPWELRPQGHWSGCGFTGGWASHALNC